MVTDFLIHYAENLKGLEFSRVAAGSPINSLYDGANGGISVTIPAASTDLSTAAYRTFHPDLEMIRYRNPRLLVSISTTSVSGAPHTKQINLRVEWDAPLRKSLRLSEELYIVRVRDL